MSRTILLASIFLSVAPVAYAVIVGVRTQFGVVIGADGRRSQGGSLVTNRVSNKFMSLSPTIVLCNVNNKYNNLELYEALSERVLKYEILNKERMPALSVAKIARQLIHSRYRDSHVIIAGLSDKTADTSGYTLCERAPGGSLVEPLYFATGAGSALGLGYLENRLSPKKEAGSGGGACQKELECSLLEAELCVKAALGVVTSNDGGAGGAIKLCTITAEKAVEFS